VRAVSGQAGGELLLEVFFNTAPCTPDTIASAGASGKIILGVDYPPTMIH
jgi:hypothetical protein